ncbi:UPAR/Ly6 domain-containing protein rtv-like [Oratosquilla oratoria]|uniref:UPAR/Ly6 domain-containing protein rtv-like n=1 Tax=Oratosquilla oratoria TaxID=337810 RepID=UPI003F7767B9
MSRIILIYGAICVLCFLVSHVKGFRCYDCFSQVKSGDCHDPFNKTVMDDKTKPCKSGWCKKTTEEDPNGGDDAVITIRECLRQPPQHNSVHCSEAALGAKQVYTCFCNENLCNTGSMLSPSYQNFSLLLTAVLIQAYRE